MISNTRITAIIVLFILTFAGIQFFDDINNTPILKPLNQFPTKMGDWGLVKKRELSQPVVDLLGVDDYIDYTYVKKDGSRIDLYVSYFGAIGITGEYHSPQNCLPGGGWKILDIKPYEIELARDTTYVINKLLLKKGSSKQVVYYWFQNRGRVIRSEYWDKIYTVLDSIFKRRKDGSFIRIMTKEISEEELVDFTRSVFLELTHFIPGK